MKKSTIIAVIPALCGLVLLYAGMTWNGYLLDMLLPKDRTISYTLSEDPESFFSVLYLSTVIALVPMLLWLTWKFTPVRTATGNIISGLMVITCGIAGILWRRFMISSLIQLPNNNSVPGTARQHINFPLADVHFDLFLLGGLLAGCGLSYLVFRQKKTPVKAL